MEEDLRKPDMNGSPTLEQYLGFFHHHGFLDFLDLGDPLGFDLGNLVEVLCRDGPYLHTMAVTGFLLLFPLRHVDAEEIEYE
jgi:hypothetical protein